MTNLFSVFDPTSSVNSFPLNWGVSSLMFIGLHWSYWASKSRSQALWGLMTRTLTKEASLLMPKRKSTLVFLPVSLFILIFSNNLGGLLPYVFTSTSHLKVTLALSLPLWIGLFLYGYMCNFTHSMSHLVPQGTPVALMPVMVLIESISSVIRPFTLSIRLAANMIAGHLLIVLLSGAANIFNIYGLISVGFSLIVLMVLETAVAMIQAYVFATLMGLYISEV
uniref:ATP synthase subunit a n=1 Tax=Pleurocryptella fimbriata TaxID=2480055 RepID=A0A8K1Y3J9_9CRUS|nr:ATP synthase F0 subunit 6 [Pleurocryptella fimbriata]